MTDVLAFDFNKAQLAIFCAGAKISAKYVPQAAKKGCICIDNTSHFRQVEDIPLVIPEVNPEAIADFSQT